MKRTFTMTDNEIMRVMTALAEMTYQSERGTDEYEVANEKQGSN